MSTSTLIPELAGNGAFSTNSMAAAADIKQIVAQEEHLGFIRELTPPDEHIGLSLIAPWMDVDADDVIFDYLKSTGSGLAPAIAQDAESKLFRDVDDITGVMRASVVDWRLKSRYASSDVMTHRDFKETAGTLIGANAGLPLYITNILQKFRNKVTRDTVKRKLWLDNRIEWLILTAISTGKIAYNDGEVKFDVDFFRPANQQNADPHNGVDYSSDTHDPINDLLWVKEFMFDEHYVNINRAICSRKFANSLYRSGKFNIRSGFNNGDVDMKYAVSGWGPASALKIVSDETEIEFIINDNVFRARNVDTGAITNQRFIPQDQVIFLPDTTSIDLTDNTDIGFAKTLTSPHPMGNFTTGFYSWEQEETDPWQHVIGSGVKAFPVFPHMEKTYTMKVGL